MATQLLSLLLLMSGNVEENPGPVGDEPYRFTVKNILRQIGGVVDWKSLGIELDIDPAKLGEIDKNCRGAIGDCRMSMIEFWINSDTSASWKRLAVALEGISQNVKAQEVRELGRKEAEAPPSQSRAPPPQSRAPPTTRNAPPPPSLVLGEAHCTRLFQMTKKAADRWRVIGWELGFKADELDALVREPGCHFDEDYYAAVLKKWLDWAPPKHPLPTLSALVAAIRKSGKERLANDLENGGRELCGVGGGSGGGGGGGGGVSYRVEEDSLPSYPEETTPTQPQADPSKVLQENYCSLVGSIQDADTLADRLYAKGVIASNVREKVEGCRTAKEKNRVLIAAVQQQVGANPRSFQTFIDVLKMDKSNDTVVSLLTAGGSNGAPIGDMRSDSRPSGVGGATGGGGGKSGGTDDFPDVSGDQLGEDDLVDVVEEVMDVASRWKSLGLALRLKAAELDTISSKNHTDPTECLRDMLLAWLQQRYDSKRFGPPSWRILCQAISKQAGGNNPALAREIAEGHH